MAVTSYPVNHPAAVKHWSADVFKEALKRTYALKFIGSGSGNLIQLRNEMKSEGDRVRVFLRLQLSGNGVTGDGTLEGNEEALSIHNDDVFIDQLRHAVRSGGKMSEQRVPFEVREEARDGLADWWADKIDTGFFNQISGNSGESNIALTGMQASTAPTSESTIVVGADSTTGSATTNFELSAIDVATELAMTRTLPIRPLMMNGEDYYVLFVHPFQATDIRRNTNTAEWADFQKSVLSGGYGQFEDNPIFSGALGIYNGTVIHRSTRVPTVENNTAGLATRRAIFCGAQAAAVAFGYENGPNQFSWVEELFDYENQLGVAAGAVWGLKKMVFNSIDLSTITITSVATAHSV